MGAADCQKRKEQAEARGYDIKRWYCSYEVQRTQKVPKTGKNKITYTSGGEIDSVIGSIWKNSTYENYSLNINTYQGAKLKDFTNYNWANGSWAVVNKFAFILDGQLNLNQVHFYINQGGVLKFVRRYRYYYESFNSTIGIDNINAESTINVYPNPATTTLNFEIPSTNAQVLKIYDLAGKLLLEKAIEANTTSLALSTSNFTNGNGVLPQKKRPLRVSLL